jgi:hypothetical protein
MTAVVDSAPLILLAGVGQFSLLRGRFGAVLVTSEVHREVLIEGRDRSGQDELGGGIADGWVLVTGVRDQSLLARLRRPALSLADSEVVACAVENGRSTVVSDDAALRRVCIQERLPLVGTVGLLVHAKLEGTVSTVKPLLDQLIAHGFRLDPGGSVYREALRRVGEEEVSSITGA